MHLTLNTVDLKMLNGNIHHATQEGNNAAWMCPCGKRELPLLGTTRPNAGYTQCDKCDKKYRVLPNGTGKKATGVEEIQ